jgi:drug/metabolite transporter (DMT)-like permease
MFSSLGILLSVCTFLLWSVGDFYIQKSTRSVGIWKSLFYISFVGVVLVLPFVWLDLGNLFLNEKGLFLLTVLGLIVLFAALFDFEALKRGKIAVVEPVFGMEIPITVFLGIALGHDVISTYQLVLILIVIAGVFLAVMEKGSLHYKKLIWEKGFFLAIIGTIAMSITNFLTGIGSQTISPVLTIWFINFFMTVACFAYLVVNKDWKNLYSDFKNNAKVVLTESLFDNAAWLSYAYAMTLIPISIATTITQSYIIMTVLLGVSVNKEKLNRHQVWGILLAIVGMLFLSATVMS